LDQPVCHSTITPDCEPETCRWRCALEVIDELLSERGAVSGEEADHLLDLRWLIRQANDAEAALRTFCDLRLRMEQRHYLAFFRIRRWLENHLVASVQVCPAAEPHFTAIKLDRYCVEAIRRMCLCAALGRGSVLLAPRVRFVFWKRTSPAASAVASVSAGAGIGG
jgi:hypothetical protein